MGGHISACGQISAKSPAKSPNGDLDGTINVCIRPETPLDPNSFIPISGCVLIETDDDTWEGPFSGRLNLVYGAFGDYFEVPPGQLTNHRFLQAIQ